MKIAGSKIIVTGGGAGIGHFLANRLNEELGEVYVLEKDLQRCADLVQSSSGKIKTKACDVSDPTEVDAALDSVFCSGFEPDILINNAGIIHSEPLVNLLSRGDRVHSRENWRRVLAADLDSVFFVTSRVVDHMLSKRRKGVVISISSVSAGGNPGQSAYSAAKAGVNSLTRAWAKEWGAMGLRFVAVSPGFMETASTHSALSEAAITRLRQQIPLRRLGELESVFLAVRHAIESDYLTGTIIEVDGGIVI